MSEDVGEGKNMQASIRATMSQVGQMDVLVDIWGKGAPRSEWRCGAERASIHDTTMFQVGQMERLGSRFVRAVAGGVQTARIVSTMVRAAHTNQSFIMQEQRMSQQASKSTRAWLHTPLQRP